MLFMDSRLWNAPLPVFCRLLNTGKLQLRIFLNRVLDFNRGIVAALVSMEGAPIEPDQVSRTGAPKYFVTVTASK